MSLSGASDNKIHLLRKIANSIMVRVPFLYVWSIILIGYQHVENNRGASSDRKRCLSRGHAAEAFMDDHEGDDANQGVVFSTHPNPNS